MIIVLAVLDDGDEGRRAARRFGLFDHGKKKKQGIPRGDYEMATSVLARPRTLVCPFWSFPCLLVSYRPLARLG